MYYLFIYLFIDIWFLRERNHKLVGERGKKKKKRVGRVWRERNNLIWILVESQEKPLLQSSRDFKGSIQLQLSPPLLLVYGCRYRCFKSNHPTLHKGCIGYRNIRPYRKVENSLGFSKKKKKWGMCILAERGQEKEWC